MRFAAFVFAAALVAAAPALAQVDPGSTPVITDQGAPPATQEPAATTQQDAGVITAENSQERICRTVQRSESRLRSRRERVCGTQAEWDQMNREGADLTRNQRSAPPAN